MMPEATSLASRGEMQNFVHVWVCRRMCSKLHQQIVSHTAQTVGSLFGKADSLEEMCYRMGPYPLQGGKALLQLRKGSEILYFLMCQNKIVAGLAGA